MALSSVQPFVDVCQRENSLAKAVEKGNPIIGYLCNYTPVELIHACGFMPFRITGGPGPLDKAYDLVPDFVCPFLKRVTERALNGEFNSISGIIQGYTCDAACGVVKVLEKNMRGNLFEVIPFPYADHMDSRKYFRNTLASLKDQLEGIGGSFSERALNESINLYQRIRRIIDNLYDLRYSGNFPMTAGELWYIVRAGEITTPDEYLGMLEVLMEQVREAPGITDDGIPVLVSGSLVEDAEIFNQMESCGARVVADDLCTGLRSIGIVNESDGDPPGDSPKDAIDRLINMHHSRVPCPSRTRAEDRLPGLLDIIKRSGALGVVFLHQKFCSPHLSDFPYLSAQLREKDLKSIQIEMDETWKATGQFKTRMESFLEMVRG